MVVDVPAHLVLALGGGQHLHSPLRFKYMEGDLPWLEAKFAAGPWKNGLAAFSVLGIAVLVLDMFWPDFQLFSGYVIFSGAIRGIFYTLIAVSYGSIIWSFSRGTRQALEGLSTECYLGVTRGREPCLVLLTRSESPSELFRVRLSRTQLQGSSGIRGMVALRERLVILSIAGLYSLGMFARMVFAIEIDEGPELGLVIAMMLVVWVIVVATGRLYQGRRWLVSYVERGLCPSCQYQTGTVGMLEVRRCSECGFELPFVLDGVGDG